MTRPAVDMMEALRLTRQGRLEEAMAVLRGEPSAADAAPGRATETAAVIDMVPPSGQSGNAWTAAPAGAEPEAATPPPQEPAASRPSFDCGSARTRGEIAVCNDNGLAALDLNMATQYRRALASADPDERALLQSTRDRFLRYRDRCSDRQCIADAYVGRMREIRDIAEGNWQPPR